MEVFEWNGPAGVNGKIDGGVNRAALGISGYSWGESWVALPTDPEVKRDLIIKLAEVMKLPPILISPTSEDPAAYITRLQYERDAATKRAEEAETELRSLKQRLSILASDRVAGQDFKELVDGLSGALAAAKRFSGEGN